MPEELSREIQKLEMRLKIFTEREEIFTEELRKYLDKLVELNKSLERLKTKPHPKRVAIIIKVEELMKLRLEAMHAFNEALKKESEAEHEKSHLLESYGALILVLEGEFKDLLSRS